MGRTNAAKEEIIMWNDVSCTTALETENYVLDGAEKYYLDVVKKNIEIINPEDTASFHIDLVIRTKVMHDLEQEAKDSYNAKIKYEIAHHYKDKLSKLDFSTAQGKRIIRNYLKRVCSWYDFNLHQYIAWGDKGTIKQIIEQEIEILIEEIYPELTESMSA